MVTSRQIWISSIGLLILRLGTGAYMLTYGLVKVQMLLNGQEFGDPIGIGAMPSLVLITFAEFGCAILVMVGLLTRLAAVPLVIAMSVAAFVGHGSHPWTMTEAYELFSAGKTQFPVSRQPAIMFLIPFLTLIFTGPGKLSLDALIWRRKSAPAVA